MSDHSHYTDEAATPWGRRKWRRRIKRGIDILVSLMILVVFTPLMGCIALLILWRMGRLVIFRQRRPGLHECPFTLYKFRTMNDARGPGGRPLPDGERLTRLGRFLRRTSLDELPQLWNVLRGDMSLVGPRPLLVKYLSLYSPEQARRHEVKPGITGWAQINGRNSISWDEKFSMDCWYVEHWNLWLDMRILAVTAWIIRRREGISAAGHSTMPPFTPLDSTRKKAV